MLMKHYDAFFVILCLYEECDHCRKMDNPAKEYNIIKPNIKSIHENRLCKMKEHAVFFIVFCTSYTHFLIAGLQQYD